MSQEDGHGWRAPGSGPDPAGEPAPEGYGPPPEQPPPPAWQPPGGGSDPRGPHDPYNQPSGSGQYSQYSQYGQQPSDPAQGQQPPQQPSYGSYGQAPGYGPGTHGQQPVPGWGQQGPPPAPPGQPPYGPGQHGGQYGPGWGQPPAPQPGIVALRPLVLADIFNGAFSYIRQNPKATLGLSLIVMAIASVLPSVSTALSFNDITTWEEQFDPAAEVASGDLFPYSPETLLIELAGMLLNFMAMIVLTGLLTAVVGMAVLGYRLTMAEAWRYARDRLPALAGLTALLFLISVLWIALWTGAVVLALGLGTAVDPMLGVLVGLLATFALVPLGAWVYVKLQLATPAVVLERLGPGQALGRSWRLTEGSWWRIFGLLLLALLLITIVSAILSFPFQLVATFLMFGEGEAWAAVVIAATTFIGIVLGATITYPFSAGVTVLIYVDMRIRREGLDLRLRTSASAGEHPVDAYLPSPAPGGYGGVA